MLGDLVRWGELVLERPTPRVEDAQENFALLCGKDTPKEHKEWDEFLPDTFSPEEADDVELEFLRCVPTTARDRQFLRALPTRTAEICCGSAFRAMRASA